MKWIIMMSFLFSSTILLAQKKGKRKIYKYKKYEKLYLDELSTSIGDGALSDLSLDSSLKERFKRSLPSRSNFKPEVIRSMRRIK